MKKMMLAVAMFSTTLILPVISQAQDNFPVEISYKETKGGNWEHIGDISFTNQRRTSEEVLESIRIEAQKRGAVGYHVTRLQMMNNGFWSANAAIYSPRNNMAKNN
ncbi:DUF1471 domain-containing protein [Pantoea sp. S18]|uniref:DUF1471 domain-containing protein n=1 Tax=Pantoea sp. S18 TaxID=3019892 RepID=UPI0012AD4A5A|nr:DUF1471 domain-containing protein [Pantoea sp. S18]MEA5101306.1 DUF1471 domain-containing protein [Pantoea sp. S18]MRT43297.1 DUF1471 domain-containing protein [Enterobacteriaceae bacterium RIT702]